MVAHVALLSRLAVDVQKKLQLAAVRKKLQLAAKVVVARRSVVAVLARVAVASREFHD